MRVHETNRAPNSSACDGFIIVAVLWILVALATLASIYSIYINNSALAVSGMDDGLQAEALVSAGLELTAFRLTVPKDKDSDKDKDKEAQRPTSGQFAFRLGRANVTVNYSSETARIDLNAAPKALLAGFFAAIGASNDDADRYADRIIGWRQRPKPMDQAGEAALYRSAGLPYLPRGAPFAHASELWLVQGLPPELIRRALPFVTVYSGRPDINVFDAPPELIAALPDMTPARLATFLNHRDTVSRDKDSLSRLLGPDQPGATAEGSNAFRVKINIAFQNGWRTGSEAVILLDAADEPFQVLSWRNDVDTDQPQIATRRR
ncbi:MAG: type II secretion system protein GspK [Pseudolabrys sp.]